MNPVLGWVRALAGKFFVPHLERKLTRFQKVMQNARTVQREVLFQKIRHCQNSKFGVDHHFSAIRTLEDFRRHIPIADYSYYQPYIQQVTEGNISAMFPANERILMYTMTSGTTDQPKLIPVTSRWMDEYRAGWQIWGLRAFFDHPQLFYSKITGIAGNYDMRRTKTNKPCGMASGLSARLQTILLKMVYTVPASVFEINDPAAKYYSILRLAIPEKTGLFMTATPSTVVNFAKLGDQQRDMLLRDIADGTMNSEFEIPHRIKRDILRKIKGPNPARAKELEAIIARTGRLYPKDYWNLSLVACWLGGTVGTYAQHIAEFFGDVPQRDIGLLCSEGRFTIPIEDGTSSGALEVASHYYEFIPEDEIDSKQPTVLECHELEVGKSYYILLTTSSGLYRYHISDVLRCTGFVGETPLLEFLHKGQRVSDMEGEKITEFHLVKAVSAAAAKLGFHITGFTAVPVRPEENSANGRRIAPYYALMLEEQDIPPGSGEAGFLEFVDTWLRDHNVMYAGRRSDGYLGPLQLVRIPTGAWKTFDLGEIASRGVSEDHYKHPCLVMDADFLHRFPKADGNSSSISFAAPR